jgi:hypothetical protein
MTEKVDYHFLLPLEARGRLWISSNQRLFWAEKARRTKAWRDLACVMATQFNLPWLPKAHIIADLHFPDRRVRDANNYADTAKACIDGLVDAGMFDDDDHTRVVGPDMRISTVLPKQHVGIDLRIFPLEAAHENPRRHRRLLQRMRGQVQAPAPQKLDGDDLPGGQPELRPGARPGMPDGFPEEGGAR